ncbi:uncharacterized protein LOC122384148 [Amphibalanus amphitrite]|uniref:uncharacterized protein LOC122384148 n=1 Tax=Amphibalanus amphitrite TaxID=1232801 RepID=UPI001C90EE8F|nr:uncharacterized protein LOC122384148 [Amphibalanus amphitrite]
MISRCLVTLLCLLTSRVSGERSASVRSAGDAGELIEDLDYGSLPDGITSDTVVVTYFYDSEHHSADTGHQLLKKLSKYFRRRPEVDIRLCKVSCTGETGQFCRRHLVNRAVHAFRQGHPRVTLSLTGPSPLDAAIATSLHLWLAERVAVLNTAQELAELQTRCRGRCNILTAYFPSLGASEHRLLLEAALDENTAEETTDDVTNRLQFVMTSSEEAVVDLPPPLYQSLEDQTELLSPRLWMLLCGGGGDGEPLGTPGRCHAAGFHWELSAEELRHFLRASTRPGWVKAAGAVSARELPFDLRRTHVTLLLTDVTSLGRVTAAAPALGTLFRGSVGFVILDLDSWPAESLAEFGLDREHLYLPSLAFITRGMETASAVLNEYDDAVGFIQSQLIKYLKQVERQQRAETEWDDLQLRTDNVPAVLKQDDELELLLTDEDDFSPVREIGDEEFNTLSRSDEFAVLVAYLPWDPVSRCLLRKLTTLPADLRRHLGRLSCLDWSELCDRVGVRSHPTVLVLAGGHRRRVNGSLTAAAVTRLLSSGAAPVPLPVSSATLERWMDGQLTGSPLDGTDGVLLIAASQHPPSALTGPLRGEALLAQVEGSVMQDMFGKSSPLCIKRNDPFQTKLEIDLEKLELAIAHCVPVMPELDEETLHLLPPSRWTFLLFCSDGSCPVTTVEDRLTEAVGQLALTVPHCFWISSSSPVGRQARQQYQLTSSRALVAVNLTSGQVVKYTGPGSAKPVLHWADRVLSGHITGEVLLKSEPWLPVLPPIDFSSSRRTETVPTAEADTLDIMDEFQGAADGPQTQRDEL